MMNQDRLKNLISKKAIEKTFNIIKISFEINNTNSFYMIVTDTKNC